MAVKGGTRLKRAIRDAKTGRSVTSVEVGFFSTSKYPDGTPVTNVAAWNEFGTENKDGSVRTPQRPFFRNATKEMPDAAVAILAAEVDPVTMVVTPQIAAKIGLMAKGKVQKSITRLKDPGNADSTKARKKSKNPLIDTGFMRSQATYRVNP